MDEPSTRVRKPGYEDAEPELPLLVRVERAKKEIEDLQRAVAVLEGAMKRVLGQTFLSAGERPDDEF